MSNAILPLLTSHLINVPLLMLPSKAAAIATALDGRLDVDVGSLRELAAAAPPPSASNYVGEFAMDSAGRRKLYRTTPAGVAVIPVIGSLVRRASYLDTLSGLTSYELLSLMIAKASVDPDVTAIVLDIDSPGGEAVGAFEVADVVRDAAKLKPVIAVAGGLCCSAAFAIASAANQLIVTKSSMVGSIGVVWLHADHSRRLDKTGISVTLIHAGARKVDGHPYAPLTPEITAELQAEIDCIYALFVDCVVTGRKRMTAKAVRATEARTFIGADAVKAGLADEVGTFAGVIADLDQIAALRRPASRPALVRA